MSACAPTIANLLESRTLKWVFVGGKGGVGKTTCSCSIATQLAKVHRSVLLVSTDPAHNLSDAFGQKFGPQPIQVNGFTNLSAMEIEPSAQIPSISEDGIDSAMIQMFKKIAGSLPGIDEAFSLLEISKLAASEEYSIVVFDTAPTGHTLRFLALPAMLESTLSKVLEARDSFGPLISLAGPLLNINADELFTKVETFKANIEAISKQFCDAEKTTFVCVCIAEFLSLYETERLVQELSTQGIAVSNIIVNQLLLKRTDAVPCPTCEAKMKVQAKYLEEIDDLYEPFHVSKLPLLPLEVRGADAVKAFSEYLVHPFQPDKL